jgi:hypothetical protein
MYKKRSLESSGTPVLYKDARFLKGKAYARIGWKISLQCVYFGFFILMFGENRFTSRLQLFHYYSS